MNQPYHRFVFEDGRFVGAFDAMYAAENAEGFDSWRSRDTRHLRARLTREIVADYAFRTVLDIGCGVGTATQFLKRVNNQVLGIDVSPAAIEKARQTFPDIDFMPLDAMRINTLGRIFDLISVQVALAYIPDWGELLQAIADKTQYALICEFVPANAVGFVKSVNELVEVFQQSFLVERKCVVNDETVILFGQSKLWC